MSEQSDKFFSLGFTLEKIDVAKRRVCGTVAIERPDKAGEIMDYATARPNFEKWSSEIEKNSGGKSKGNLRVMHTKEAAGKLIDLSFNDVEKSISCVAEIVDDNTWNKCLLGVYSGFSMGGKYEKMWKDASGHMRYTPVPLEVSLVDNPAIPGTTFQLLKDSGEAEMMKFAAYEGEKKDPTEEDLQKAAADKQAAEDAAKEDVRQVWLDCEKGEHLTKAAAVKETVKIKARKKAEETVAPLQKAIDDMKADLSKSETTDEEKKKDETEVKEGDKTEAKEAEKSADGDLQKVSQEKAAESDVIETKADLTKAIQAYGRSKDKAKMKAHIKASAKALRAEDELPEAWGKFASALGLKKGMGEVSRLACLILEMQWLKNCVACEAATEGDGSKNPSTLSKLIEDMCSALTEMVTEETAEMTDCDASGMGPVMAYAALLPKDKALALSKFSKNEMLKGALEKAVGEQTMEKSADVNEQLEQVKAEKEALEKTVMALLPKLEEFQTRLKNVESQPQRPKGVVRVAEKGAALETVQEQRPVQKTEEELQKMTGDERGLYLMKQALANPIKQ